MPQARGQRARGGRRGGGGGVPWLWLAALVLIGAGVLAARTLGRPREAEPAPNVTATARSVPPGAAPAVATPKPTVVPTARPATATVASARAPTAVATVATPTTLRNAPTHAVPSQTSVATTVPTVNVPTVNVPTAVPQTSTASAATPVPQTSSGPSLALTFDAGADRGYAEDILDVLQEAHVVASFGVTGNWAKANPDLVRRMVADGHLIFNHTLDHRSFTGVSDGHGGLSPAARRAELDEADAVLTPLIGHTTRPFYRLPYGDDDARVAGDVASDGYTRKLGWTVDSLGWRGAQSADIVARCVKLATAGAVYVFHVGRASQDAIALPQLIHALRDKGFSFKRVDQE